MDIVDSSFDSAEETLDEPSGDTLLDPGFSGEQHNETGGGALFAGSAEDTRESLVETTSTDVYADVMRDVPLLSPEEEEQLGKVIHDSRLKMTRALSLIPAASVALAKTFAEVEQGERPRTDLFFTPVQAALTSSGSKTDTANENLSGARRKNASAKRRGATRWTWRDTGRALISRIDNWRTRRGGAEASDAANRLAIAFCKLEPGFVALREALDACQALDKKVSAIEAFHGCFHADLLSGSRDRPYAESRFGTAAGERASARTQLRRIELEAGTDLISLRACCRAASEAYIEYRSARTKMVNANLRLAHYLAYRLVGNGVAVEDLVQEAIIGLMRAVDRFDYRRGYKFSTYAYHWIRQTTALAIAEASRTVRVAPHMHDRMRRLRKLAGELEQRFGRDATAEELVESSELTPTQVKAAIEASRVPASLDAPLSTVEDSTLHVVISDPDQADPSDLSNESQISEGLARLLDTLPPRESFILRLRNGIGVREAHTLEDIGARLGITRERTRQLESQALAKLREQLSDEYRTGD